MADPIPSFFSIRSVLDNVDYVANWVTTVAVAGGFSVLVSLHDKLAGAAILVSLMASSMLAMVGWVILLEYGYGGLGSSLALAVVCGVGGMIILSLLIGVLRRWYSRRDDIADEVAERVGLPKPPKGGERGTE